MSNLRKMDFLAFTRQEKAKAVSWYIQTDSITATQRRFRTFYGKTPPVRNSILRWAENFTEGGNVENRSGRGRPSIDENTIQTVSNYFRSHPRRSIRRAETDLNIPRSTVHKILKKLIHMFPYKIRRVQQLQPQEYAQRVTFATYCFTEQASDVNFLHRIVFSDECVFHVSGMANTHNTRIWGTENPHETQEHETHSEKITVWCGIHSAGVLDPYYFNNETVRGEDYYLLLDTYVRNEKENFPQNAIYQHDGAPPHISTNVRHLLDELFPDSWIGRYGPQHWPARSPDLTPPDFYLWGYAKDRVFSTSCV